MNKGFVQQSFLSARKAWSALLRPGRLKYMLLLSLGPVITNQQGRFFDNIPRIWNLDPVTLAGLCFFVGAGPVFVLLGQRSAVRAARWGAGLTALAFLVWLVSPWQILTITSLLLFVMGLGFCAAEAVYAYVHCLNGTERLFGAAVTSLYYMLSQLLYALAQSVPFMGRVQLLVLVVTTFLCLIHWQAADFTPRDSKGDGRMGPALPLMMLFFVSHMVIEIFYSFLPDASSPAALLYSGMVGLLSAGLCLWLYFRVKVSVWYMCSLYLIAMLAAFSVYLSGGTGRLVPAYLLHGFEQMGFIASFYLFGQVMATRHSPRAYRRVWLGLMGLSAIALLINRLFPPGAASSFLLTGAILCFALLAAYMLLLPLYSRHLFLGEGKAVPAVPVAPFPVPDQDADSIREALMQQYQLTPREQEITRLLLQGLTVRQCAAILQIAEDTVKFHTKHIYRKLGINGRPELFALFSRG